MSKPDARERIWSWKKELDDEGGFHPFEPDIFPGYFVKRLVTDEKTLHMIQFAMLRPGAKKVHRHDWETVFVVLEGEGETFIEEDKTQPVKAGDIVHALSNEAHGFLNTGTKPLKYLTVEGPWKPSMARRPLSANAAAGQR